MEPIDPTPPALEILQRRMAANLQRLATEARRVVGTGATALPSTPAKRQERRRALRQRLQALDSQDPRFAERAADAFVESVLLDEFGDGLTNDANFRQLILQVSRDMRGDTDTALQLLALFGELRGR